jgi:hypothetical protein
LNVVNGIRMRAALCGLASMALGSCTALDRLTPQEHLDARSGDTLVVVNQPLVFARERSDVAVRARDYTTLVAVEADRAGRFAAYLLAYRWSTIDRRMAELPAADQGALRIAADGREVLLQPLGELPAALQAGEVLHAPPDAQYLVWGYVSDIATLAYLADCRVLSLQFPRESLPLEFQLWSDGRAALREFAARAAGR